MKLEEAIEHLEETLNNPNHEWSCSECKAEHEQLLEWLKDYKRLLESSQGDWIIESQETSFYKIDSFKCSGCGWKVTEKSRFCPYCGARMNYQS